MKGLLRIAFSLRNYSVYVAFTITAIGVTFINISAYQTLQFIHGTKKKKKYSTHIKQYKVNKHNT